MANRALGYDFTLFWPPAQLHDVDHDTALPDRPESVVHCWPDVAEPLPQRLLYTVLSFSLTLPQFTTRRNNRNPASLDWSSDGCTSSPDNPFGFPFVPACHRHDFGYHNFRAQTRFTESNKLRIDNQFRTDLKFQCQSSSLRGVCNALADVYYAAVRAFGGDDATPGKRDEHSELVAIHDEKVAIYDKLVAEAQAKGQLWTV
ncbi:hypothetical protein BN1723_006561 [Verticillium longisporum]|uniref:Uncharacterized protein n=1 Tax=Verticillium longisporum TaxID=100787 RepID=A0A0G4NG11_VERLO|nr:hypothetical protein BN1723_006561 [Verticillium longisporum]